MYVLLTISKGLMKVVLSALDSLEVLHRKALIGAVTHNSREYEPFKHTSRVSLSYRMISTRSGVSEFSAESD